LEEYGGIDTTEMKKQIKSTKKGTVVKKDVTKKSVIALK
jgi:hypothetical protein